MTRLDRDALAASGDPAPSAPVRIAHLGLGAFHRAHQAWYTHRARDRREWGIAAFTGRNPAAAETLRGQQGVYTLVERSAEGDSEEIITSISEAHPGSDDALMATFRSPQLAVVTSTVTERGYRLRWNGSLDVADEALTADLARLDVDDARPATVIGRLVAGLRERWRQDLPGVAVAPCDNIPRNGEFLETGVLEAARMVDGRLAAWIAEEVSFVSTSVDRITPRMTAHDVAALNAGWALHDAAPVITEPFSDWVLQGRFPAGRPSWEDAGARFVDDIEPWERRKLWMLNGAHTLLAVGGLSAGHATVAEAIRDSRLSDATEALWEEAARHLPADLEPAAYAAQLRRRFENPRIEHRLEQIAQDSFEKLKLRIIPVAEAERAAGGSGSAAAFAVAAWATLQGAGADAEAVIRALSPRLADDDAFVAEVTGMLDGALA